MTTVLFSNDWHLAVKDPAMRIDDYNAEIFACLDQILRAAIALKASAICVAGDWFHDKKARLPYGVLVQLVMWLLECRKNGVKVIGIAGNHDERDNRYESLQDQPLGLLIAAGLIQDCSRQLVWADKSTLGVYGVPWPDAQQPDAFRGIPGAAAIVLGHCYATPDGDPIYGEHCHKYQSLAAQAAHVRVWHFGHDHTDHGVMKGLNGSWFINIGALSRGALDTDTLNRTVKMAYATFDQTGVMVKQVALDVKPAAEVFDIKLRAQKRLEKQQVETFIASLTDPEALFGRGSTDYQTVLTKMPLPDNIRQQVETYISRAEAALTV